GGILSSDSEELIINTVGRVCRQSIYSLLGESAGKALLFFLEKDFGRDPFEVLWESPRTLYSGIEKILGAGTKILINILVDGINKESNLNMSPELFLELMRNGDQRSTEEIRLFLRKVAESSIIAHGMSDT
ncbi:MAG: hypothetical protein QW323_00470, partial [Candidatus Bathyarchaeia archaeon]